MNNTEQRVMNDFECTWCKEADDSNCEYPMSEFGGYSAEGEALCRRCIFEGRRHDPPERKETEK